MTNQQVSVIERQAAAAPTLRRPLHEGFPVKDADTSLKFYTEVLGLKVLPRPNTIGPGYWVGTEDKRVEFHIIETDAQYIPGPDAQPAAQARHTAWLVDSLEDLRRHLDGLGVPYREQKGRVGADQVFIVDPDGHTWEFQEPSALYPA
jgi:catechol 2,3-dioxygenase-like lactoylglutathione lyase family enzyme